MIEVGSRKWITPEMVRPVGHWLFVRVLANKDMERNGIIIPQTADQPSVLAEIVAAGEGTGYDPGQTVMFERPLFSDADRLNPNLTSYGFLPTGGVVALVDLCEGPISKGGDQ